MSQVVPGTNMYNTNIHDLSKFAKVTKVMYV